MNQFFTKVFCITTILLSKDFSVEKILNIENSFSKTTLFTLFFTPIISTAIDKFINQKFIFNKDLQYCLVAFESLAISTKIFQYFPQETNNIMNNLSSKTIDDLIITGSVLGSIMLKSVFLKYILEHNLKDVDDFAQDFKMLENGQFDIEDIKALGNIVEKISDEG